MLNRIIVLSQILFLSFPVGIFSPIQLFSNFAWAQDSTSSPTPSPYPTPSPCPTLSMGGCEKPCQAFKNMTSDSQISMACGLPAPSPSPGNSPIPIYNNGRTYNSYDDCKTAFLAEWGQLGQYCATMDLYETANIGVMISAISYTAAGAVCAAACAAQWTDFTGAAQIACTVAGTAGTLADIAASIKLSVDGARYEEWFKGASPVLGAAGTAFVPGAILGTKAVGQAAGSFVSNKIGSVSTSTLKGSLIKAGTVPNTNSQALTTTGGTNSNVGSSTSNVAKQSADKAKNLAEEIGKAPVCMASVFFLAIAGVKWANYGVNNNKKSDTCNTIKNLAGIGTANILLPPSVTGSGNGGPTIGGGGTGGQASFSGHTYGGTTGPQLPDLSNSSTFPPQQMNLQSASALAGAFDSLPNRNEIPDVVKSMGSSLNEIGQKLQSSPPGAVAASMLPNLPSELSDMFNKLDNAAKNGKLSMYDPQSSIFSSSGGGATNGAGGSDQPNPFSAKRAVAGISQTAPKEAGFDKTAKEIQPIPSDGDIWHSNWNGTIFQIISHKLTVTRERVDQVEWITPLNRALNGLPKLVEKKGKGGL